MSDINDMDENIEKILNIHIDRMTQRYEDIALKNERLKIKYAAVVKELSGVQNSLNTQTFYIKVAVGVLSILVLVMGFF